MNIRKMNEEEVNNLLKYFEERFGIKKEVFDEYNFYKTSKKVWIANKSLESVKLEKIYLESLGMHFATINKKRKIFKISTDASQIFGKQATKNIVEITDEKLIDVLRGFDLINFESEAEDGYVLLKYKEHILGVGLKNKNFIKNMIPKERRLKT
ncbi:MAG: hypothetical protein KQA36_00120 [Candidatus Aenigmarchaeota archaeon]|nr:hypothetical protein [Candidatus Aenigmarchaeota archaeon]